MKLVRDNYDPKEGFTLRSARTKLEHSNLLIDKLNEELRELILEDSPVGGAIKAGDLIEAAIAYCLIQWGLTEEEVMAARKRKLDRLGGFTAGKVWVEG